jgi:hypothetical protein
MKKFLPFFVYCLISLAVHSAAPSAITVVDTVTSLTNRIPYREEPVVVLGVNSTLLFERPFTYTHVPTAATNTLVWPLKVIVKSGTNGMWVSDALNGSLINVRWFGALGNGTNDDTAAITSAANLARSLQKTLFFPPTAVGQFYYITDSLDFTDILNIYGDGAEIRGQFTNKNYITIGGSGSGTFTKADIRLNLRSTDAITNSTCVGFFMKEASQSRFKLSAWGFEKGIYFEGVTTNRAWVGNRFDILWLKNNAKHVEFNLGGDSYFVKNSFIGGSYSLGTGNKRSAVGTYKITLTGNGLLASVNVDDFELSVDGGSYSTNDQAVLVYADINTSWFINTIEFTKARFEGYTTLSSISGNQSRLVNINSNPSGRIGIGAEFVGDQGLYNFGIKVPTFTHNRIRIADIGTRPQGDVPFPQIILPPKTIPYATSNRVYIPDRTVFDSTVGYGTPANYLPFNPNPGYSVAIGDGDYISGDTLGTFGLTYKKLVPSQTMFCELHQPQAFVIICYDANGNIIGGTSPYYAMGENFRSTSVVGSSGTYPAYQFSGRWFWLDGAVDSFFIGAADWDNFHKMADITFNVMAGSILLVDNKPVRTQPNLFSESGYPRKSFWPVGTAFSVTDTNVSGWVSTFFLKTSAKSNVVAGATTIYPTNVTGIATNDTLGIEVDYQPVSGLVNYEYATVTNVSGGAISFTPALSTNSSIGRTLIFNRWASPSTTGSGGGGSSTNILVNGTLVTQANLKDTATVIWSAAGSNITATAIGAGGSTNSAYVNGVIKIPLLLTNNVAAIGISYGDDGSGNTIAWVTNTYLGRIANLTSGSASTFFRGDGGFQSPIWTDILSTPTSASGYGITNHFAYYDQNNVFSASNQFTGGLIVPGAGTDSTRIGPSTAAAGSSSVAIGDLSSSSGYQTVSVGYSTLASGTAAAAYGTDSTASGNYSIASGYQADASGLDGVAIGSFANSAYSRSVSIGYQAAATAANQIRLGITGITVSVPGLLDVIGQASFTLGPTMPTQSPGDNTTKGATTAFVTAAVAAGVGGGGLGTNLFLNNVLKQPAKITNSATITWTTNAAGDILANAAGGGGSGAGTNINVNGTLIQPANLITGPKAHVSVSGTDITITPTNLTSGDLGDGPFLPLSAGLANPITGFLTFNKPSNDHRVGFIEGGIDDAQHATGFRVNDGTFSIVSLSSNDFTVFRTFADWDTNFNATMYGNLIVGTNLTVGGSNVIGLINAKGNLNSLSVNGTAGATNAVSSFSASQVKTNGDFAVTVANREFGAWTASQTLPMTNAAANALFKVRGDGWDVMSMDGNNNLTTGFNLKRKLPPGKNYASGVEFLVDLAQDNNTLAGSNFIHQLSYQILSPSVASVDVTNYTGVLLFTNQVPAATAVFTNITWSCPTWTSFTAGQLIGFNVSRLAGSDINTNNSIVMSVEANTISQ